MDRRHIMAGTPAVAASGIANPAPAQAGATGVSVCCPAAVGRAVPHGTARHAAEVS